MARKDDPDYQKYSPIVQPSLRATGAIEFAVNKDVAKPSLGLLAKWFGRFNQSKFVVGSKWAIFQKSRLERVIRQFEKRNNKLQTVLILAGASQQYEELEKAYIRDPDAQALGLSKHARIREIVQTHRTDLELDISQNRLIVENEQDQGPLYLATLATRIASGNEGECKVLIELKYYPEDTSVPVQPPLDGQNGEEKQLVRSMAQKAQAPVSELATLLAYSGSQELGTLPLKGVLHQPQLLRNAFVFEWPSWAMQKAPVSLQDVICTTRAEPWPLNVRFRIAQRAAQLIGEFHGARWLHKNISSQSLAFFFDLDHERLRDEEPFLVDFGYSRSESGSTARHYDGDVQKDYYRHPAIQCLERPAYRRIHDVYSLGVVLLEIAIWQQAADMISFAFPDVGSRTADNLRKHYIKLASRQIPHRMGMAYAKAVLSCLEPKLEHLFRGENFAPVFRERVVDLLSPKLLMTTANWSLDAK